MKRHKISVEMESMQSNFMLIKRKLEATINLLEEKETRFNEEIVELSNYLVSTAIINIEENKNILEEYFSIMYGLYSYATYKIFGDSVKAKGIETVIEDCTQIYSCVDQHNQSIGCISCTALLNYGKDYETFCKKYNVDEMKEFEYGFNSAYELESDSTGIQLRYEEFRDKLIFKVQSIINTLANRFTLNFCDDDIRYLFDYANNNILPEKSYNLGTIKTKKGNTKKILGIDLKVNLIFFRLYWKEYTFMVNNKVYSEFSIMKDTAINKKNKSSNKKTVTNSISSNFNTPINNTNNSDFSNKQNDNIIQQSLFVNENDNKDNKEIKEDKNIEDNEDNHDNANKFDKFDEDNDEDKDNDEGDKGNNINNKDNDEGDNNNNKDDEGNDEDNKDNDEGDNNNNEDDENDDENDDEDDDESDDEDDDEDDDKDDEDNKVDEVVEVVEVVEETSVDKNMNTRKIIESDEEEKDKSNKSNNKKELLSSSSSSNILKRKIDNVSEDIENNKRKKLRKNDSINTKTPDKKEINKTPNTEILKFNIELANNNNTYTIVNPETIDNLEIDDDVGNDVVDANISQDLSTFLTNIYTQEVNETRMRQEENEYFCIFTTCYLSSEYPTTYPLVTVFKNLRAKLLQHYLHQKIFNYTNGRINLNLNDNVTRENQWVKQLGGYDKLRKASARKYYKKVSYLFYLMVNFIISKHSTFYNEFHSHGTIDLKYNYILNILDNVLGLPIDVIKLDEGMYYFVYGRCKIRNMISFQEKQKYCVVLSFSIFLEFTKAEIRQDYSNVISIINKTVTEHLKMNKQVADYSRTTNEPTKKYKYSIDHKIKAIKNLVAKPPTTPITNSSSEIIQIDKKELKTNKKQLINSSNVNKIILSENEEINNQLISGSKEKVVQQSNLINTEILTTPKNPTKYFTHQDIDNNQQTTSHISQTSTNKTLSTLLEKYPDRRTNDNIKLKFLLKIDELITDNKSLLSLLNDLYHLQEFNDEKTVLIQSIGPISKSANITFPMYEIILIMRFMRTVNAQSDDELYNNMYTYIWNNFYWSMQIQLDDSLMGENPALGLCCYLAEYVAKKRADAKFVTDITHFKTYLPNTKEEKIKFFQEIFDAKQKMLQKPKDFYEPFISNQMLENMASNINALEIKYHENEEMFIQDMSLVKECWGNDDLIGFLFFIVKNEENIYNASKLNYFMNNSGASKYNVAHYTYPIENLMTLIKHYPISSEEKTHGNTNLSYYTFKDINDIIITHDNNILKDGLHFGPTQWPKDHEDIITSMMVNITNSIIEKVLNKKISNFNLEDINYSLKIFKEYQSLNKCDRSKLNINQDIVQNLTDDNEDDNINNSISINTNTSDSDISETISVATIQNITIKERLIKRDLILKNVLKNMEDLKKENINNITEAHLRSKIQEVIDAIKDIE